MASQTLITFGKRKVANTSLDMSEEVHTEEDIALERHNEILEQLKNITGWISGVDQKLGKLEQKVDKIESQHNEQKIVCENLLQANSKLETDNALIRAELQIMRRDLQTEIKKRDALECHDRKFNLEFSGAPKRDGEDPKAIVGKFMRAVGASQSIADVDIVHRKMNVELIARFCTRTARDAVYESRFNLRGKTAGDIGFNNNNNSLFINESLTFDRSSLMKSVRDIVKNKNKNRPKENKIRVKTAQGQIKIKNPDGAYKPISSMKDLSDFFDEVF